MVSNVISPLYHVQELILTAMNGDPRVYLTPPTVSTVVTTADDGTQAGHLDSSYHHSSMLSFSTL
jgi:hypothetical protein